jgi:hypothetical protein
MKHARSWHIHTCCFLALLSMATNHERKLHDAYWRLLRRWCCHGPWRSGLRVNFTKVVALLLRYAENYEPKLLALASDHSALLFRYAENYEPKLLALAIEHWRWEWFGFYCRFVDIVRCFTLRRTIDFYRSMWPSAWRTTSDVCAVEIEYAVICVQRTDGHSVRTIEAGSLRFNPMISIGKRYCLRIRHSVASQPLLDRSAHFLAISFTIRTRTDLQDTPLEPSSPKATLSLSTQRASTSSLFQEETNNAVPRPLQQPSGICHQENKSWKSPLIHWFWTVVVSKFIFC